jgi:hypothetical protein
MREGDPGIIAWQTWSQNEGEPLAPPGMKAGGPWYPFAAGAVSTPDGTGYYTIERRPLVRAEPERDVLAEIADELQRMATEDCRDKHAATALQEAADFVRSKVADGAPRGHGDAR